MSQLDATRACSCPRSSCITKPKSSRAVRPATSRRGSAERSRARAANTNSECRCRSDSASTSFTTNWCGRWQTAILRCWRLAARVWWLVKEEVRRQKSEMKVEVKKVVKVVSVLAFAILLAAPTPHAQQTGRGSSADAELRPTEHPRVPADITQLWLAPEPPRGARSAALTDLASAVKLEVDESFSKALPILSKPEVQQGTLGHYAVYYRGLAQLRLGHAEESRGTFQSLEARAPVGYLAQAALLREAEGDESVADQSAAMNVYDRLSKMKTTGPDEVLMRLGKAAKAVGNTDKATEAFSRLAYEYPYSELATQASAEIESLPQAEIVPGTDRYTLTLGRAERLFGAKRYALARTAFESLRRVP